MNPPYAWQLAREQLEGELPLACFDRCIRNTRMLFYHDGLFWLGAPDDLARRWLERNLTYRIRGILTGHMERSMRVYFIVEGPEIDLPLSRSSEWEGLTPLSDELVEKYGVEVAAVGGKIWVYSQRRDQFCPATISTLADELNVSRQTLLRALEVLIAHEYVMDLRSSLQPRPHRYVAAEPMGPFDPARR